MMIEEFEQRTGFFPTLAHYKIIEQYYINFEGDKDTFCEAYKQNTEGIAERIQREANIEMVKAEQGNMEESARKDSVIDGLERKLKSVNEELEKEQEWQHYELPENVSQADYEQLAKDAEAGMSCYYMSDEEAVQWICDEFGFDCNKITILHDIDELEINRHGYLRHTGRKIDRRPVYCTTDYHYIRFNTSHWYYEVWNGRLRPFYD